MATRPVVHAPRDSVAIVPGAQYHRGKTAAYFLGEHYRDTWGTRIQVSILNLQTFGGGLTPILAHAGSQTRSLRFAGEDGRTYQFREIVKNPLTQLPPEERQSIAAWALEDGASSSHPYATLVASALLGAAGVLHVQQTLVVIPDDPALGKYRAEFAGRFGLIEERADETASESSAFAGARQVISPGRLFERLDRGPQDRVDARAFLRARLMDILMGDRDRHRDQFRWAQLNGPGDTLWEPISRDHDEAFVKHDGVILKMASHYVLPLVDFTEDYPAYDHLNWHAREIDRRFLVELDRPAWDSVAVALQARLTDAVIDSAVRSLPREVYGVGGEKLAHTLKVRRDKLRSEAWGYYSFLAGEVEIHATNAPEIAEVTRVDDHHVDISIRRRADGSVPYFQRRFSDLETHEVRLKMWGGDDRVVVRGDAHPDIKLRVVGGDGDDELIDSTRTGGVAFYDDAGHTVMTSLHGSELDTRHYTEWIGSDSSRYPPREWGSWLRPLPFLATATDMGGTIGAGFVFTQYGFRKSPYASNTSVSAGYATGPASVGFDIFSDIRRENRSQFWTLHLLGTGLETTRYYGLGNQSTAEKGDGYYRLTEQQYRVEPSAAWPLGSHATLAAGPVAQWSHMGSNFDRFISTVRDTLYGADEFGEVGGRLAFTFDARDKRTNPRRGFFLSGEGRVYPALWDLTSAFGSATGRAETYLSADIPLEPTLAFRGDAKKLWGTFPFQESAFLGGATSLRGYYRDRFAGDASVSGSTELRLTLVRSRGFLPALWGAYGNADAGRVYLDGRSPGGWHTGVGGGAWVSLLDRSSTAAIGATHSSERTIVYSGLGFAF